MSAIIQEYTYEDETHLDEGEALDKYRRAKIRHPEALIVLNDLDCGHWEVKVYTSKREKEEFLKKKADNIFNRFLSVFKK